MTNINTTLLIVKASEDLEKSVLHDLALADKPLKEILCSTKTTSDQETE